MVALTIVAVAALALQGAINYYNVTRVIAILDETRRENSKLTAALLSETNPVASAVYQTGVSKEPFEQVLVERAERRAGLNPLGM